MRLVPILCSLLCLSLVLEARGPCRPGECVIKRFHLGPDGYAEVSHLPGDKNNPAERPCGEVEFVGETSRVRAQFYDDYSAYCPLYTERDTLDDFDLRADWPTKTDQTWMRELRR